MNVRLDERQVVVWISVFLVADIEYFFLRVRVRFRDSWWKEPVRIFAGRKVLMRRYSY